MKVILDISEYYWHFLSSENSNYLKVKVRTLLKGQQNLERCSCYQAKSKIMVMHKGDHNIVRSRTGKGAPSDSRLK